MRGALESITSGFAKLLGRGLYSHAADDRL